MLWAGGDSPTRGTRLTRENRHEIIAIPRVAGGPDLMSRESLWRGECRGHATHMALAVIGTCFGIGIYIYTDQGPAGGDLVGVLSAILAAYAIWHFVKSWRERNRLLTALRSLDLA